MTSRNEHVTDVMLFFSCTAAILVLLSRTFPFERLLRLSRYHGVLVLFNMAKINLLARTQIKAGASIRRPRRLFKRQPFRPGVYTRSAFNRGPAFN